MQFIVEMKNNFIFALSVQFQTQSHMHTQEFLSQNGEDI